MKIGTDSSLKSNFLLILPNVILFYQNYMVVMNTQDPPTNNSVSFTIQEQGKKTLLPEILF